MTILENIGFSILGLIFLGTIWVIFNLFFNGLLSCTTKRFKLPTQKRFKGRMTPIHELSSWSDGHSHLYWVSKWEIKYSEFEMGSWQSVFIPFSVLFSRLKYVNVGKYKLGALKDEEVAKLDISIEWHKLNQTKLEKELEKEIKSEEYQRLMDYVNKDFKQNYTE
jgi:hypothetical protein